MKASSRPDHLTPQIRQPNKAWKRFVPPIRPLNLALVSGFGTKPIGPLVPFQFYFGPLDQQIGPLDQNNAPFQFDFGPLEQQILAPWTKQCPFSGTHDPALVFLSATNPKRLPAYILPLGRTA